jgi:hypothetical protein
MMLPDRVRADFDTMRTDDPQVFAAGDGAFGGSTLVMAMHHGQRAAYYVKNFLMKRSDPIPYRTPYRTRQVPVAQDLMWEKLSPYHPEFLGLGADPVAFPEIEATYDRDTARNEAARCYRCDAETGSADYSVQHREDIFSMARTHPADHAKLKAMLHKRLSLRENPFPEGRPATLDDLVFLPANLSRLVIDPYREACKVSTELGGKLELEQPFLVTGFDQASEQIREGVARGLAEAHAPYLGIRPIGAGVSWLQLLIPGESQPSPEAAGLIHISGRHFAPVDLVRVNDHQLAGITVSSHEMLEDAVPWALDAGLDMLLLDGSGALGGEWPELAGWADLRVLRDAVRILRRLKREEAIDLVYFGGVRSGTDAAKLIGMGAKAVVLSVPVGLAVGGQIQRGEGLRFGLDYSNEDRTGAVVNIVKASVGEASMMARCTGKTNLHNIEPEDLRAITDATATATGIPLVGTH